MSSIMITVYDSLIHVLYLWYSDSCPILVIQLRWSLPKMGIPLKSTVFYLQICYNHQNWCLINFLKNSSEKYTKPSIINCGGCNKLTHPFLKLGPWKFVWPLSMTPTPSTLLHGSIDFMVQIDGSCYKVSKNIILFNLKRCIGHHLSKFLKSDPLFWTSHVSIGPVSSVLHSKHKVLNSLVQLCI